MTEFLWFGVAYVAKRWWSCACKVLVSPWSLSIAIARLAHDPLGPVSGA